MTLHRQTNQDDLLCYLQENQAYLRTILTKLQESSSEERREKDDAIRQEHLKQIKEDFSYLTQTQK